MAQRMSRMLALPLAAAIVVLATGCGESSKLPESAGFGPTPQLPEPKKQTIPTVHVATAKGWADGKTPVPAEGMSVTAFAGGLDHPRWVYVLPNGDVLVAESNAPPKPDDDKGIKGWFSRMS